MEMKGIVKRFGPVLANDHVDFAAGFGEIHALLGENGAGKSTLMSILCGLYKADEGEIRLRGLRTALGSPKASMEQGIGIVHQHFRLVERLTAFENMLLGEKGVFWHGKRWLIKRAEEVEALAERYGLSVPLHRPVWQMSVGEQQRVEILKTLIRGASIILLDEPTSVLTPAESESLYHTLRKMRDQGKTMIVSTHKLKEVMAAADRISVMRKGRMIAQMAAAETDIGNLARLMVGRDFEPVRYEREGEKGGVLLKVEGLAARGDHGHRALNGIGFEVQQGEIVGIAGVAGNGQKELAEVLTGLRASEEGRISCKGRDITSASVADRIGIGISHVPENRIKTGLAGPLGSVDNLLLKAYRRKEASRFGMMRMGRSRAWSGELVQRFDVRTPDLDTPVGTLSGGNQQKLLLAREVSGDPELMVAMHPTQGLDVGAARTVHEILHDLRKKGSGVLLISEDLDELLALSDRILVLYGGRIVGGFDARSADISSLGLLMAGIDPSESAVEAGEAAAGEAGKEEAS